MLAFYYTWFDNATWSYDQLSDLPSQSYVSSDRATMGRHIDQARSAGIDALIVAWYGPGGGNQTEPNLAAMLEEAAGRGFRVGILFETNSPFMGGVSEVTAALSHALNSHGNQSAFLRVDGRPVIFFWRTQQFSVDTWRSIRQQVDPDKRSYWIADGVDTSYLAVFDGHFLYSNTWNPPADLTAVNQKFAGRVANARQSSGAARFWVATVMPGYDDTRVRPGSGFARARDNGAYYAQSWAAAIASQPSWVVITSFNEWPEGSYIEPSVAFGDSYLSMTAQYSQQFKAGGGFVQSVAAAALAPPATATPEASPTPAPTPSAPTLLVQTTLLNIRRGPGLDYEILDRAAEGSTLPIVGRTAQAVDWWQVELNGQSGWVSAELGAALGPLEQVPEVDVSPIAIPTLSPPQAAIAPARRAAPGWQPILSGRP